MISPASVVSYSVWPYGLQPANLYPWDSPGKNTRVGCYILLQGIFLTQGLNLHLLHLPALAGGFFAASATWETQYMQSVMHNPLHSTAPPQQQPCGLRLLWSPCYRWRNRGTEGLGNLPKITPFAGKASLAGEKAAGPQSLHSSPKFPLGGTPTVLDIGSHQWASPAITHIRPTGLSGLEICLLNFVTTKQKRLIDFPSSNCNQTPVLPWVPLSCPFCQLPPFSPINSTFC